MFIEGLGQFPVLRTGNAAHQPFLDVRSVALVAQLVVHPRQRLGVQAADGAAQFPRGVGGQIGATVQALQFLLQVLHLRLRAPVAAALEEQHQAPGDEGADDGGDGEGVDGHAGSFQAGLDSAAVSLPFWS